MGLFTPAQAEEAAASAVAASATPVRVYPNPWRSDRHQGHPMTFDNLLPESDLQIFTVSGHEVRRLATGTGKVTWDLANDSGDLVASGIYIYLGKDTSGEQSHGKLAVIR